MDLLAAHGNHSRKTDVQYMSVTYIEGCVADVDRFLPLSPADFQVLVLLSSRKLHGYGLVHASAEEFPAQPPLDLGTLYRIISRMLDDRLIREVKAPDDTPADRRTRRYYQATDAGRAVARAEALRLRSLLASRATLDLLATRR
jgi:DNA-binding PadR family transcriptional regulator